MRKYLFFAVVAMMAILLCSPLFYSKTASAQSDNARQNASENAAFNHEKVDPEKAKKMMDEFVRKANKGDHKFTKFNRQELIDALAAMDGVDTVKFVIGATIDDEPGKPKTKPVILLQLQEAEREQPGGHSLLAYSYLSGGICPPPHGRECILER